MSLMKKREMTKPRLEALAKNRENSRGPASEAGRERIRAANLRHGFYSKADETALRALGEDPAQFRQLLEDLSDERTVAAALRQGLAHRMARAFQRMDRADRMQDGFALRQAREQQSAREGRLHVRMMQLKTVSRTWQWLAQSVARPYFVTTPAELSIIKGLRKEGVGREMSEVALSLFYQLREPGLPGPGDPGFVDDEQQEQQRQVLIRIKEIFGLNNPPPFAPARNTACPGAPMPSSRQDAGPTGAEGSRHALPGNAGLPADGAAPGNGEAEPPSRLPLNPHPEITEAQWRAREPVRQLLENILTRQVEILDTEHRALLREVIAGPSPYERAAELVPKHPESDLIRRMENSNCRQILRMSSLLIRLRQQEVQMAKFNRSEVPDDV
jgi:hypothetical protein